MFRKTLVALIAGSVVLTTAACNMVKGAGRDIQSASQSTEDAMNGK